MSVLVCGGCLQIYRKDAIKGDTCPNTFCPEMPLIEVDGQLADVVVKLWELELNTEYCCAGHIYEPVFEPYIIFSDESEEQAVVFHGYFQRFMPKYKRLQLEDVEEHDGVYTWKLFARELKEEFDIKERLEAQNELILFLYEFIDKVNAIKEDVEKKAEKVEKHARKKREKSE